MASGKAEASIARSPEDVWKVLRDFAGLADYMPGIESCTVDGDVRTIGTMGIEVKEQLATISVEAEGQGTHLVYSVDVEPDDLLALFLPIYEGSVVALKEQFES